MAATASPSVRYGVATMRAKATTNQAFMSASDRIRRRPLTHRSVGICVTTTVTAPNMNINPMVALPTPSFEA